jgi:hypothetical protein
MQSAWNNDETVERMSLCPRCGASFECGMVEATAQPCWCTRLPALPAACLPAPEDEAAGRCFCPDCLRAMAAEFTGARS